MMLPDGWVTDIVTQPRPRRGGMLAGRSKALKVLGNGVVPPQAAYAIRSLLARIPLVAGDLT